ASPERGGSYCVESGLAVCAGVVRRPPYMTWASSMNGAATRAHGTVLHVVREPSVRPSCLCDPRPTTELAPRAKREHRRPSPPERPTFATTTPRGQSRLQPAAAAVRSDVRDLCGTCAVARL